MELSAVLLLISALVLLRRRRRRRSPSLGSAAFFGKWRQGLICPGRRRRVRGAAIYYVCVQGDKMKVAQISKSESAAECGPGWRGSNGLKSLRTLYVDVPIGEGENEMREELHLVMK